MTQLRNRREFSKRNSLSLATPLSSLTQAESDKKQFFVKKNCTEDKWEYISFKFDDKPSVRVQNRCDSDRETAERQKKKKEKN